MLSSNGVVVEQQNIGRLTDCTAFSAPDLKSHFEKEGYVFIRNALDRKKVLDVRRQYFVRYPQAMLVGDPGEGIFSGKTPADWPDHGRKGHPAFEFVQSSAFLELCETPELYLLSQMVLGVPSVKRIKRTPLRSFFKGTSASRAHTDLAYLSQGTSNVATIWVPIGHCTQKMGSLAYLEGSHYIDSKKLFETFHDKSDRMRGKHITHDLNLLSKSTGRKWLTADFAPGDIVAHLPQIVHASLDCQTDAMRLSADVRFYPENEVADPRWSDHWNATDGY